MEKHGKKGTFHHQLQEERGTNDLEMERVAGELGHYSTGFTNSPSLQYVKLSCNLLHLGIQNTRRGGTLTQ